MTKENKKLLLKDLAARFPYGVVLDVDTTDWKAPQGHIQVKIEGYGVIFKDLSLIVNGSYYGDNYKPYLRHMSSMTEEEFEKLKEYSGLKYEQLDLASYQNGTYKCLDFYLSEVPSYVVILVFEWLNKHHFDYRQLIEKGLAIAVTEENNPYKE
jgi:hypothetical protein